MPLGHFRMVMCQPRDRKTQAGLPEDLAGLAPHFVFGQYLGGGCVCASGRLRKNEIVPRHNIPSIAASYAIFGIGERHAGPKWPACCDDSPSPQVHPPPPASMTIF